MVRSAIEDITYHGGSTLTAQAVELSVDDLIRGRRPDALQVVVLMNDGLSQDSWDRVLSASDQLAATRAERFGVALGDQASVISVKYYVNDHLEPASTFLVGLLQGEKECAEDETRKAPSNRQSVVDDCSNLNLDLVVLFDNTDKSPNMKDPTINANRYLLLDVLGSLPSSHRVRIMIISFSNQPKVELDFTDLAEKDKIFTKKVIEMFEKVIVCGERSDE
uniref:VWFA domain-containing protein n=1 Tax=Heterorhabditis bacteriophora TaxID=37862 RepID=A0A1I7WP37_HETBA